MSAQDIPRSNAEVRNELYIVYAEIHAEMQRHKTANAELPHGHVEGECEWCTLYKQRMIGIRAAIRHFGGNPRTIPKQCRAVANANRSDGIIVPWPNP